MLRIIALVFLCVTTLVGCNGSPATVGEGGPLATSATAAVEEIESPAVDAHIDPVSLSHPSAEAAEAIRLCVPQGETHLVGGIAEVASAREVPRYGWFHGSPPELDTDSPAWIVQYNGDLTSRSGTYHDPTCVVIDGVRTIFATGGFTTPDGKTDGRSPEAVAPELALPAPQP